MPVTTSVTVCSTWMRGLTSMKKNSFAFDVEQEFDRAGVAVADRPAQPRGRVADAAPAARRQVDARRDLDHLLVPALHRAVALPQVHEVAVRVAEDLHFDVLGRGDVALEEDFGPAERRRRLRAAPLRAWCASSSALRTTRMPRPPPPKLALMISG